MPGTPSTAIRNQVSAALAIGPGPPASSRSSGPASSSPATTAIPPSTRASSEAVVPSRTARSRWPAPYQRAARAVVPYSRNPPSIAVSDSNVPATPSAASGSLPRCPTTAVSTSTNDGSAASTTNAEADSRSMRAVVTPAGTPADGGTDSGAEVGWPVGSAGDISGGEPGPRDGRENDHVYRERQQAVRQFRAARRAAQNRAEGQPPVRGQVRVDGAELRYGVGHLAGHGEHQDRGYGADRVLGEGGHGKPDRAERGHCGGHVQDHQQQPGQARAEADRVPRQQRDRADREQDGADDQRGGGHGRARGQAEDDHGGVLDGEQPGPPGRHGEEVAQGAVAGLAGHRVTGHDRYRQRQHQREEHGQRREGEEHAVSCDLVEEGRPAAVAAAAQLQRHADQHRDAGQNREQGQVANAAEDQAQLRAQEPEPRPGASCRTRPAGSGPGPRRAQVSR